MTQSVSEATILVPIDASDPGKPSAALVELLSPHSVVVLGYYPVPDQSSTDQLRSQFGEEAEAKLASIRDRFSKAGADTECTLVFTKDRSKTDRVATETGTIARGDDRRHRRVVRPARHRRIRTLAAGADPRRGDERDHRRGPTFGVDRPEHVRRLSADETRRTAALTG
jgi:hypothetical protein